MNDSISQPADERRSESAASPTASGIETVLEVRGAHKRFGDTQALAGVDVSLARGEWLGLLGPNGAGKTTLIRALAGRVELDSGSITIHGRTVARSPASLVLRDTLGIVPQEVALYPRLTAAENLAAWGALQGVADGDLARRVAEALSWTNLEDRRNDLVEGFSGGMKRRLNLACATLHEPSILLLDEPTVGVDPHSRERIWEMLAELQRGGASLLLTTHQLDEAQQVCERITIVDHGRTVASGRFDELVDRTIGSGRLVTVRATNTEAAAELSAFTPRPPDALEFRLEDLARELPRRLEELRRAGVLVTDLEVEAPTLQDVFLHLTGHELRE